MAQLEVIHETAPVEKADLTIQTQEISDEIDAQQLLQLQAWNTPPPPSVDFCIHELIQNRCDTQPEAAAVCAWNGQLTYAELDVLSSSVASELVARGVIPERFVPVCLEKSVWTPVAMLAVLKAGGAFVLLDPSHPTQRLEEICRAVKATVIIASKDTAGRVATLATETIIIDYETTNWTQISKPMATPVKPGNAAYTVFTSGTSGKPKGVVIEHRSLATTAVAHSRAMNMHAQSRVLQFASYAFDACLLEILTVLIVGGCICMPSEDERQRDLAAASRRMQVNWMFLTPSLARVLEVEEFPTLQTLVVGGEALQKEDMRKWAPHVQFFEAYGPTECAVICMARQCLFDDPDPANIGFGAGVTCWIVDPDDHSQLAPIGSVGELLLDGAPVGRGYINDAERTASVFIDPPAWHRQFRPNASGRLYKTGDLACYSLEDGSIRYIGRKDSQVKLRGQRLELGEVEFHLRRLFPAIVNVVVEMVTPVDMADSPILIAFILQEKPAKSEADKLIMPPSDLFRAQAQATRTQLQESIPKYMMPAVFLPLKSMPLVTSGKSDRRQLRELATALTRQQLQVYTDVSSSVDKRQPSTATAQAIQQLWSQVLHVPRDEIGLDDNFFSIGGSSVFAMKLLGVARRQGLRFELGTLYTQTLKEIAAGLEDRQLDAPETNTISPFSLLPDISSREIIDCVMQQCELQDQQEIEDVYPCTPLQEGLMSLTAKRPGAYIVVFKYDLPVDVDIHRFQKAWNAVVQANPILRTRIVQTTSGAMYQAVLREAVPWEAPTDKYHRDWNAGQRLVRLLLSPGPSKHFTLVVHHALSDGWAVPLVLRQVEAAYHGKTLQQRPFNGFISYLVRNTDAQDCFWKEHFVNLQAAVFPPLPSLGYIPNPTVKRTCSIPVGHDVGHSTFTTPTKLKLAWAILVSLYTDSPDVVFGITVTGRGAPVLNIEEMTGPTIATIPIQLHVDPEHTISEALLQVQDHSISTVPFEQAGLQNISRLGPDSAAACQFQSLMVIQPQQERLPDMFSVVQDLSELDAFSSYAITLICKQSPDSVQVEATFDPEVVDEIQLTRMLQQLQNIVQQLTPSNESLLISNLSNTSSNDMAQLLEWNRHLPKASDNTLHGIVLHQKTIQPDADAVCAWDGDLSYRELDDYSARLAQYLLSLGIIESESRVAVCLEKSRWTIVTLLAVLRAGGVCVLIDHGHPRGRIEEIVAKTSPPLLVASATYQGLVQDLESKVVLTTEAFIQSLPPLSMKLPEVSLHQGAIILFTSGSTGTPKGIVMEHVNLSTSILAHSGPMNLSRTSRSLHFASYAFDVSIYEIFNTLAQGGCVCVPSESDRMNNLANVIRQQRINWALLTPSTLSLFGPADVPSLKTLILAGEAVTRDPVDKWADKVTLINAYGPAEATFTTTGPIPPKGWRSGTIGNMYGSVGWVTDAHNPGKLAAIGAVGELLVEGPIVTRGYLDEPEKTAASYIATPAWLRRFRENGEAGRLYRTGDLVQYNPDGTIRYVGRRDTQVKLRGQRIELGEVEYHVQNCFDLTAEVVAEIIVPRDSNSPVLVAYIFRNSDDGDQVEDPEASDEERNLFLSPKPSFRAAVQQIESKLSDSIPSFMVPGMFLPLREVPLTRSGKVDRRQLREATKSLSSSRFQLYSAQAKNSTKRAPSTDTERVLQEVWANVLRKDAESIGLDDNFFRLGGDSISAMQVVAQCTAKGLRVTVATIFRAKTIARLTETLEEYQSDVGTVVQLDQTKRQQSIHQRTAKFQQSLESAASLLPTEEKTGTLSDFPSLPYTYFELEEFIQHVVLPLKRDGLQIEDAYPCTPIQQGILLSQARDSLRYRNRWSWSISSRSGSPVDLERLRRAWQQVVQRHPLLRTVFFDSAHRDGSQHQAVLRELPAEDVCTILPAADDPLKQLDDYELPSTLPLRPPTRLIICGSPSGDAACLLDISHAVVDGMSRQVFWGDLCQAYEDQLTSTIPATYREYFEYLEMQPLDDARAYWEEYLRDVQPCLFPASSNPEDAAVHSHVDVVLPFDQALRQFCSDHDATLANIFQLAWALVLRTYLNADSACFGYVTSGRDVPIPNIDITVGPFINMLVCNMSLQGTEKILDLLEQSQVDFVQSLTHQGLALGEKTRCSKVPDTALFNTVMSVQREVDDSSDKSALVFKNLKTEGGTEYDLGVNIEVAEESIGVSLLYTKAFLSDKQAQNVIDAFQQALLSIISRPAQKVHELSLFGSLNKRNLQTHSPQVLSPVQRCVHDLIHDQYLTQPSSQAVCAWDGDFTYAEVDRLSSSLAGHLSQYNIAPESYVGIYSEKSRWAIIAMVGVMKAGAAFILLDPSYPIQRLQGMCENAQISVVISSEAHRSTSASLAEHVVTVSDHEDWSAPTSQPPLTAVPRNAFCALFTSGSTGKPKGVVIEHQAFSSAALAQGPALNLDSKSRVLQFASYAFDASVYENITTLIHGGCVCIPSEVERRQDLACAVNRMQVNWAFLTPSVARILDPADFPSLKTMVLAGELISAKELKAWQASLDLHLAYGPAECSIMCVGTDPVSSTTSGRDIGFAVGCRSWVVDPNDHENLLPLGAVGELLIEGPGVGRGYINEPEKTAAAFVSPPSWLRELINGQHFSIYKTGDLVKYNENGSLHYVSRKDTQVKLRGQRVELGEVEFHLRECFPDIQDAIAAVVKPSGESRPAALMAFILQNRGETNSGSEISIFGVSHDAFKKDIATAQSRLDEVLPTYMVPTIFVPLDHIPLTKTGKTDRRALREAAAALTKEQMESFTSMSSTKRPPSTEAETVLQKLFALVLNLEVSEIGVDDHFFRLGGDSIIAMKLIPLAREAGHAVDMTDVFNHPKLCDLASASRADATQVKSDVLPFALIDNNTLGQQALIKSAAERCHISTNDVEDIYPCTPLQEGLMALTAKTPGQYIARFDYDLAADIDVVRFQSAWDKTFNANPILRTRIIQLDASSMLQVVVRNSIRWHIFETQKEYEERTRSLTMNLDGELTHFAMVKSSGSFHLTLHHALYDGWSLPLLWSQVQASYHSDEPLQLRHFNHFIEHIQNVQGKKEFWQSQFAGLSAPIFPALPSPRHIPAPNSSLEHRIPNLARANTEYTASTLVQLAWAVIMSCYTDSEDVVYGLTVNGRSAPVSGIEHITGPTFATVPMRLHVRAGDTVNTALTSLQQKTTAMIPFQQIGLQYIRQLGTESATACSFQCQLVIQAFSSSEQEGDAIAHVRSEHEDYSAFASVAFFMVCHLADNGDVAVTVNYDEGVVHPVEATRMVQQFEHILRQLSNEVSKDLQISGLDLVSPQDHQQIVEWNSVVPSSVDSCVHDLVLQQCSRRPDASAISSWDGEVTYAELDLLSSSLAQQLQARGIQPGSLVPLCFERSKWSIITMISVLRIGATCVNIDPSHPKGRIQEILQRTDAKSVIVSVSNEHLMTEADVSVITVPILHATDGAEEFRAPEIKPSDAAFVAFTSGSTGKPKGIVMEHRNLCTSIRHHSPSLSVNENTRALHFASYAFDISLSEVFGILVNGGCVCVPSEFDRMNNVVPFINERNVNWTFWTPSFLGLIQPDDIPGVQTVILGGEPVTQDNIRTWASKVNLVNAYAPAETSICNILSRIPAVGWIEGTIGRIFGALAWITMPSDPTRLAPLGAVGELMIEGPTVTRGYLRDAEKTAAAYIENTPRWLSSLRSGSPTRLYRSGDLFQLNPDGSLRIIGRRDTQVKLRGQRIELGEVEHNVRELLPDSGEVAAEVVVPNGGSPVLMAFIAHATGSDSETLFMSPSPEFLAQAATATVQLRRLLPKYMVPGVILQVSKIPRNSNGKVDRRLLREQAAALSREQIQAFSTAQSTKRVPSTEGEKLLQGLWAGILQTSVEHIGADDDFFHLGGDSFAAMKLSAIARRQSLHLPVPFIFSHPILSDLAKFISNVETKAASEYTPGCLLGITDIESFVAQLPPYPFNKQDVVDIVPTTEFQSRLMVEKDITYSQLHLPTHIDPERLETALHSLVQNHAILRTVFIPYQNTHLQVVLRNLDFKLVRIVSEDLTASATKILAEDETPIPAGAPHFQPFLLSQSPTSHLLILRLTHAQYDGASFRLLSEDLASAYNNNHPLEPGLPFPTYLQFRHSQTTPQALSFWRDTLQNSQMTDVLSHCSPSPPSEPESMVKELRSMTLPTPPPGITLASLLKAAWALALARTTNTRDIVFGQVTSGRDAPLKDIDTVSGPCITFSPFRVTIQPNTTALNLLSHVQDQQIKALPYSNLDLREIVSKASPWPEGTEFGCAFTHQNAGLGFPCPIAGVESKWVLDVRTPEHLHLVTFPEGGKLNAMLGGSSRRIRGVEAWGLMEKFVGAVGELEELGGRDGVVVV